MLSRLPYSQLASWYVWPEFDSLVNVVGKVSYRLVKLVHYVVQYTNMKELVQYSLVVFPPVLIENRCTIERRIRAHARAKGWAGLVCQRVYRLVWCGTVSFEGHVMIWPGCFCSQWGGKPGKGSHSVCGRSPRGVCAARRERDGTPQWFWQVKARLAFWSRSLCQAGGTDSRCCWQLPDGGNTVMSRKGKGVWKRAMTSVEENGRRQEKEDRRMV